MENLYKSLSRAVNIRFATPDDRYGILYLLNELGKVENKLKGYSRQRLRAHILGRKVYAEMLKDKNAKIFVSEENKKILGVVTFFSIPYLRFGKRRSYIIDFVVSEDNRGKGIGTLLINAVKDYAEENGIPRVKVDTGLTDVKKFYSKNGGKKETETFTFSIAK